MADTGAPGFLPLFGDSDPFTPVQAPLNAVATALNAALANDGVNKYKRVDTLANLNLPANAGTAIGQHATVYADTVTSRNGDYVWTGTTWIAAGSKTLPAGSGKTGAMPANATPIYQFGRVSATTSIGGSLPTTLFPTPFPNGATAVFLTTGSGSGSAAVLNADSLSVTGFQAVIPPTAGLAVVVYWFAVGW